jgi:hypothetical protein
MTTRRSMETKSQIKKNIKIETQRRVKSELYEIVVDHNEDGMNWKRGQVVSVRERPSGDYWEVQVRN